eukprot:jgi/Hompol1/6845/HPOL_001314-RA
MLSTSDSSAALLSTLPPSGRVALITGANIGVGYGIVERLLEHSEASQEPLTIVMACRSKAKAEQARESLLQRYFPAKHRLHGESVLQLLLVDLSSTKSVFKACAEFRRRFNRLDYFILNAGIMPVAGLSVSDGLWDLFTQPITLAKTGGSAVIQRIGQKTAEGLGETFAANVFGHYIMIRELEEELARSGDGRILWTSSTTADPKLFSITDFQCLKGKHPYESSKRLSELVSLATAPELAKRGIHTYITSPGNVLSGILQGIIPSWVFLIVLVILRIFGSSGINISGKNAATSTVTIVTEPNPERFDPAKVHHSEINLFGRRWVAQLDIDQGKPADLAFINGELNAMYRKFREVAILDGVINN